MKIKTSILAAAAMLLLTGACKSHYEVASIQRTRILIDSRYDSQQDAKATGFLQPYKHVVDSVMGPVVGRSSHYMVAERPEDRPADTVQ